MKTPNTLYSRLALITSVTLVMGYVLVYAWYAIPDVNTGDTLSKDLINHMLSNITELKTSVDGKISSQWNTSGSDINYTAGKVGVGATIGNAELDIQSGIKPHWGIYHDSTTEELRFWNGDNRVVIGSTGNIGIGTVSPQRELHINSTNGSQIELQGTTGSWDGLQFINTGYNGYTGLMESDGRFFIDTASNGEDLTILQNGNVGIGTITPTQKLDVAGRITTSTAYGNGMGWSHMINAGQNMSFLVRNGGLYRLTIKASQSSVAAYIGQYLVYGLNKGAGYNPVIVTAGQSAATDWTFSYTLNGTYDANMIITAGTWTNQGLYIIVEKLYDY